MTERNRVFRNDRLRLIMEKRDMTQEELAAMIGASQTQVSRYVIGEREPSPDVLVRLSNALEVTIDWLLGVVEQPDQRLKEEDLSPVERKLLQAFRRGDFQELMRVASERQKPKN